MYRHVVRSAALTAALWAVLSPAIAAELSAADRAKYRTRFQKTCVPTQRIKSPDLPEDIRVEYCFCAGAKIADEMTSVISHEEMLDFALNGQKAAATGAKINALASKAGKACLAELLAGARFGPEGPVGR